MSLYRRGGIQLNINHLIYYLQVCKDKSFSKAAKNLYITQQGLSKAIRNLEEEIQTPLFFRSEKGVQLTEYGQFFQKGANKIVKEYYLIQDNIQQMLNKEEGEVRVSFSYGVMNGLSSDLILNFQETYPHIKLTVFEFPDTLGENAVWGEEVDLALTIGPVNQSKFESTPIFKRDTCVIVNEKNPLIQKSSLDFTDLRSEKIIIVNDYFKMHHTFIQKCHESGFEPNIVIQTAEIMNIHKQAYLNKGIGISVDFVIQDIDYPNINAIPFNDRSYIWKVCMITKKGNFLTPPAKTFFKYVLNYSKHYSL